MNNNEFLATQMTQTYFMIMSPEEKKYFESDLNSFTEKYMLVYETCMKNIKRMEIENFNNVNKPFGDEESLSGRIK